MPITENDIKLLQSARMTDTADGGGRMTGNVVQSGVDNNIFDDVSNLDRVYGSVSMRKVFPSVLTNTTDKYLGSRVIIDEAPADPNVHGLLFDASSLFDTREQAKVKVEGYLSRGVAAFYYLFGDHITGQGGIMVASAESQDTPAIGSVMVLTARVSVDSEVLNEQFVRVVSATSTVASFTGGDGKQYKLRLSTCDISDPLRFNFKGWGPLEDAFVSPAMLAETANKTRTVVYSSVVADAAQYYGIRPLAVAATTGAFSLKADSSFSSLLPSAQIETPLAAVTAGGRLAAPEPLGSTPIVFTTGNFFNTAQQLFIGGAVARGSLSVTWTGATEPLADNSLGALFIGGTEVGTIDYANGILTLASAAYPDLNTATKTVTYVAAVMPVYALRSEGILVTIATRSLSHVRTLASKPAKGTVAVSYLSGGRWYVLRDKGDGTITGEATGQGAGTVNFDMSTVTVTLGAMPDVGSQIIFQYGDGFSAVPFKAVAPEEFPRQAKMYADIAPPSGSILLRDSVTVAWSVGATNYSATCTDGVSTGDGTFYAPNTVLAFAPATLPPPGTQLSVTGKRQSPISEDAIWGIHNHTLTAPVVPGTVRIPDVQVSFEWSVLDSTTTTHLISPYFGLGLFSSERHTTTILGQGVVTDDGAGNLVIRCLAYVGLIVQKIGTINYATGAINIPSVTVAPADNSVGPEVEVGWFNRVSWAVFPQSYRTFKLNLAVQVHTISFVSTGSTASTVNVTPANYKLELPSIPGGAVVSGLTFAIGDTTYRQGSGTALIRDVTSTAGVGTDAGTVIGTTVTVASWPTGFSSQATSLAMGAVVPLEGPQGRFSAHEVTFRCANSPLRPGSFSVQGEFEDSSPFNVTADSAGHIEGTPAPGKFRYLRGMVDYETGVCTLTVVDTFDYTATVPPGFPPVDAAPASVKAALGPLLYYPRALRTDNLRYNAVAYTYLPLDAAILGLDPVRLPSDGRVPIFKAGRVVVVHNTVKLTAQTVTNAQTVNCGRTRLARIRVFGNDGLEITSGFSKNLDAGTITFTNAAGYSQPVVIEHRIEDEALCAEAQITGDLRLTRPLTHDFPANTSYVSSALVKGTLQAAAQDAFAQETWTNVWSDARIGVPILAQYNDTAHPIVVTNAGAITERWLLLFTNGAEFRLVGEEVGEIITGNTATPLSPVNPATGVPYFSLASGGWGSGWVAGNVLRFNTTGANFPLWVSRTVMQSPAAAPGTDQMTISIRGDIDQ